MKKRLQPKIKIRIHLIAIIFQNDILNNESFTQTKLKHTINQSINF